MIRIPPKFGSKVPKPEPDKSKGSVFERLNAKLKWERENIEPHLKDLFPLYRHTCIIFMPTENTFYYTGAGYGNYENGRDDDYNRIGAILAQI
ncbi:hypothetical protein [Planktothrix paucivesiculata]|uniref:Uncharacterized protein n=1 Tax=Planktothrix paucivesiculata PCC 9631 TaxID=671071 RepID=A0A7Z9E411_9CYAN|nr:hypothetical protein [Planktothrix paucivesiculata]VXD24351.1 conserved hypothetical protein [Planktothrix paucivesiculata PCC 9631]